MPASSSTRRKRRALRSTLEIIARIANTHMKNIPQATMTSTKEKAARGRGAPSGEGREAGGVMGDAWDVSARGTRHSALLMRQFIAESTPGGGHAQRSPSRS